MREKLETLSIIALRKIAKSLGIKMITSYRKADLIDKIIEVAAEKNISFSGQPADASGSQETAGAEQASPANTPAAGTAAASSGQSGAGTAGAGAVTDPAAARASVQGTPRAGASPAAGAQASASFAAGTSSAAASASPAAGRTGRPSSPSAEGKREIHHSGTPVIHAGRSSSGLANSSSPSATEPQAAPRRHHVVQNNRYYHTRYENNPPKTSDNSSDAMRNSQSPLTQPDSSSARGRYEDTGSQRWDSVTSDYRDDRSTRYWDNSRNRAAGSDDTQQRYGTSQAGGYGNAQAGRYGNTRYGTGNYSDSASARYGNAQSTGYPGAPSSRYNTPQANGYGGQENGYGASQAENYENPQAGNYSSQGIYSNPQADSYHADQNGYGGYNSRFERQNAPYSSDASSLTAGSSVYSTAYSSGRSSRDTDPRNSRNGIASHDSSAQAYSGEPAHGVLEVLDTNGFGFLRTDGYLNGPNDVYVSPAQIRKFNMRTGDIIDGRVRPQDVRNDALVYVTAINGKQPEEAVNRPYFEDLTPVFPHERIRLENDGGPLSLRIVDLVCPIGKGQRGMIVSPPKAGKTTLLKEIAFSIEKNYPDMHLFVLLIDERPEEVTDMQDSLSGANTEIVCSTFDSGVEHHQKIAEMVLARAKRLVEEKQDVIILLDSLTRLSRAFNATIEGSGRTLSGGLDPLALTVPKQFFGAARCMREGGSLTILAAALVDTGSRMDDVIFEEFKGTGNMELILDRKLSERRIYPAIDIPRSSTRREELLLSEKEQKAVTELRRSVAAMKPDEATKAALLDFQKTKTNDDLVNMLLHS
ncbi:MAG: transcription termination factor Rho [Lachnospiraceae bacterium]|jgi:transcription termination factor Rho